MLLVPLNNSPSISFDWTTDKQFIILLQSLVGPCCGASTSPSDGINLGIIASENPSTDGIHNDNARRIEDMINNRLTGSDPCDVCPVNGAINIDFADCPNVDILVTENITSITICGVRPGTTGQFNFLIPPNACRRICGFPTTASFDGDECDIEVCGGATGRRFTFHVNPGGAISGGEGFDGLEPLPIGPGGGGGGAGGGDCPCTPQEDNLLNVTCCSDPCTLDCAASEEDAELDLKVCGGRPPYTWTTTAGSVNPPNGTRVTVKPPTNTGTAVVGTAYKKEGHHLGCTSRPADCNRNDCNNGGCSPGCVVIAFTRINVGCDGVVDSNSSSGCGIGWDPEVQGGELVRSGDPKCSGCEPFNATSTLLVLTNTDRGKVTDLRTQQMIDDGCEPCAVAMDEAVVTVTDALGVSVATIINQVSTP